MYQGLSEGGGGGGGFFFRKRGFGYESGFRKRKESGFICSLTLFSFLKKLFSLFPFFGVPAISAAVSAYGVASQNRVRHLTTVCKLFYLH